MKILVSIGTRPEAIKLSPVINELNSVPGIDTTVCLTGQHPHLARSALEEFDIVEDVTLTIDSALTSLSDRFSHFHREMASLFAKNAFDWSIVHGDTASTLAGALAAFHARVPVAHVEAGLRTRDLSQPWPEEAYRQMTAVVTELHFAPTDRAANNLTAEGVTPEKVHVTGNTVVDALTQIRDKIFLDDKLQRKLAAQLTVLTNGRPHVLVTAHRRENHGQPMRNIMDAIAELSRSFPAVVFLVPVHPHPDVQKAMHSVLGGIENVNLTGPLGYQEFLYAMMNSKLILSDSGGVQEEAATFGVPLLVLRNKSERPEAIEAGMARLVGTSRDLIIACSAKILGSANSSERNSHPVNPFGDGYAARRIVDVIAKSASATADIGSIATVATLSGRPEASELDQSSASCEQEKERRNG